MTSSLVSCWISFGKTVFEPQSEATEEDNSKWGRQNKYKIGNATSKRKPTEYLRGKGRSFVYSSFSFSWCQTALWCRCTPLQCPKNNSELGWACNASTRADIVTTTGVWFIWLNIKNIKISKQYLHKVQQYKLIQWQYTKQNNVVISVQCLHVLMITQ